MSTVIEVENLSKAYQLGTFGTGTLSRDIERYWSRIRGKEDPFLKIGEVNDRTAKSNSQVVWSLKDIFFEVNQGDSVGIIGRNGAGKSTLLKILSRITSPTTGSVRIRGRVASLLEVGTGFHPELSGRENIYLNGAILGMRKNEIAKKFDEIVAFSGVERYIDTPVKRYSSGMYVRLAFAVAAHLESEILIVDEVLSVGDAEFQKKCLGKMNEVSRGEGRTVLFVSHNMDSISRLCQRAVFLNNGMTVAQGLTHDIIGQYLSFDAHKKSFRQWALHDSPGNHMVRLRSVRVINEDGQETFHVDITRRTGVEIIFQVLESSTNYTCGFNLYDSKSTHILSSHDLDNQGQSYTEGIYTAVSWIPGNFLAEGLHSISVAVMSYDPFIVHFHEMEVVSFTVEDITENSVRGRYGGVYPGVIRPRLQWNKIIKKTND